MHLSGILILVSTLASIVTCENGQSRKLRRYKICNGTRCKSIRSNNPQSVFLDMDSFLYSRWTRWAPCTRHCTTKRYRACKFPLVCGNTVLHEEAFCYHRGTYCQQIFENNQRDFLADANDDDYLEDYVDQSEDRLLTQESNPMPHVLSPVNSPVAPAPVSRPVASTSISRASPGTAHQRPIRHNYRRERNHERSEELVATPNNPISIFSDYTHVPDENPMCGVAWITDGRGNNRLTTRILGGRESLRGRWPWQVALLNKMEEVFCGGTLIAPRWVLTAAHCVRRNLSVIVGEHNLKRHDGTEKHYKVQSAFIHPDFDHQTVDNDVALLLLPEPVPTAAGLACLPRHNQPLPAPGTMCTILGWGKMNNAHIFGTMSLHEGRVPLVNNLECKWTYGPNEITNNMFCAGNRHGTVDSCAGDSGGPILCTEDNRWTVFGITSFGDGCGRRNKYGIYAKVPNFVEWIKKIMSAKEVYG